MDIFAVMYHVGTGHATWKLSAVAGNEFTNAAMQSAGGTVGDRVGAVVGDTVGLAEGFAVGRTVGDVDGFAVGVLVGPALGATLGFAVG